MLGKFALFFLVSSFLSGCLKGSNNDEMCNYDACAQVAPVSEVAAVESYLTANNITAIKHCSGFYYRIETPGTGKSATVCNEVSVKYKGQLINGTVFDQQTTPVEFLLNDLIAGWKNGIPLIKEGGKIYLYVPPSLAYGNIQNGSIPANSTLIFEIELVGVR